MSSVNAGVLGMTDVASAIVPSHTGLHLPMRRAQSIPCLVLSL